jgi:hypothetical protein
MCDRTTLGEHFQRIRPRKKIVAPLAWAREIAGFPPINPSYMGFFCVRGGRIW